MATAKRDLAALIADLKSDQAVRLLLVFGDDLQVQESCKAIVDLIVPQDQRVFGTLDKVLGHYRRYSPSQLQARMEEAGFVMDHTLHFNRVTRPGWWWNGRVLKRRSFGRLQLQVFDWLVPFSRRLDPLLPWTAVSVIGIGRAPGISQEKS